MTTKNEVLEALKQADIEISLTRCIGANCFNLIAQLANNFYVNAKNYADYEKIREFRKTHPNVNISVNQ